MASRNHYDVAVVGAGPAGCLAATTAARQGARVALIEATPKACHRFAGEWLHPMGVAALDRQRLSRPTCEGRPPGSALFRPPA